MSTELWNDTEQSAHQCETGCFSRALGVHISVCVDVRSSPMIIWLTGVSRADLTAPGLGRAECQSPLPLLPRPRWLFLMRQADREVSHWQGCLTHENETSDPHAGIEEENWEGPSGWNGGKGEGEAAYQLSENWVTGQGRWLSGKIPSSDKRRNTRLWVHSRDC